MSQETNGTVNEAGQTVITIQGVLALLQDGKSRAEIAQHYGKSQKEMKEMVWSHPKLKNRKAKKQLVSDIVLVDEEPTETIPSSEPVSQAVSDTSTEEPVTDANPATAEQPVGDIDGSAQEGRASEW